MATKKQVLDIAIDMVKMSIDMEMCGDAHWATVMWDGARAWLNWYKTIILAEARAKLAKK